MNKFKRNTIILIILHHAMTRLVIVESPAKCQKIEKYLGDGYKVMASYGHLTTLNSLKNIDFNNNFHPEFTPIESKAHHISKLQRAVKSASQIVIATDDDREGEAIGWHICRLFRLPVETTSRIIFHEVTESAIKRAIQNPTVLNLDTIYSQQARQILDLIVGYKISPVLWKNILTNTKNALSAGRCQTPALRLVYDNYLDIEQSPGTTSYNTRGYFTSKNIEFSLNRDFASGEMVDKFLKEQLTFESVLSKLPERAIIRTPPEPFITSTIQQSANNLMHISPKETMKICQRLYEQGYITYMRTDCRVYSKEFVETAKPFIATKYSERHVHKMIDRLWNRGLDTSDKKDSSKKAKSKKSDTSDELAQEAHEAIRPTNIIVEQLPDEEEFTTRERRLYKIIWTNTVESCMADAEYRAFQLKITAPQSLHYTYTTETCVFKGWQEVEWKDPKSYFEFLCILKVGSISYKKIVSKETIKDKKGHYTEARLVQLLEQNGIGRPSTFSSIVDKILERDYVNVENITGKMVSIRDYILEDDKIECIEDKREFGNEKKRLVIQPIGILVMRFLLDKFPEICEYEYTKIMEQDLDLIAKGQQEYHVLCRRVNDLIDNTIINNELDKDNKISIKIDEHHTYIIGKHGPVIKCCIDDNTSFKSINPDLVNDIDIDRLQKGGYLLSEIIDIDDIDKTSVSNHCLGRYRNQSVYLKSGKYGPYIQWGSNRKSVSILDKPIVDITIDDAISVIETRVTSNNSNNNNNNNSNTMVRDIDKNTSIRKGKYGDYIFYKTDAMKRPEFLKLNQFPDDYKKCSVKLLKSWILETYNR